MADRVPLDNIFDANAKFRVNEAERIPSMNFVADPTYFARSLTQLYELRMWRPQEYCFTNARRITSVESVQSSQVIHGGTAAFGDTSQRIACLNDKGICTVNSGLI